MCVTASRRGVRLMRARDWREKEGSERRGGAAAGADKAPPLCRHHQKASTSCFKRGMFCDYTSTGQY